MPARFRHICAVMIAATLLLGLLAACAPKENSDKTLTVSIPPQKYLLERIVGDDYNVMSLLSAGTNPETYDPAVSHLVGLQKSDAYFIMGNLGFEQATLNKIAENFPTLRIMESARDIPLIEGTHFCGPRDDQNMADPHVWSSVRNAAKIAENMCADMVKLRPDRAKVYQANLEALKKELAATDDSIANILKDCNHAAFLIWHPSLSYFAHDYDLEQLTIEGEGKEASPKQFRRRLDHAREHNPKIFIYEKEHDPSQSQTISREMGIPLIGVSLMGEDWLQQLTTIAHAIAE